MKKDLQLNYSNSSHFYLKVNCFHTTGNCEILGESVMEEPFSFYEKLYKWLESYIQNTTKDIELNIKLTYFNSGSSKGILEIIRLLKEEQTKEQRKIIINWYVVEDDSDIQEEVDDFIIYTKAKINKIIMNEDETRILREVIKERVYFK